MNVTGIEAVEAYDYESDPRWMDYWSNLNIPAHMASRSDIDRVYKFMFYQRYVDPNIMRAGFPSRHSDIPESSVSSQQTTSRNSGVGDSTASQPDQGATAARVPFRFDFETIQFTINAWVLVVSLFGILPVVSSKFANKACRLTLLGTACSSLHSLCTRYGKPRTWDIRFVYAWILSIIRTKDFMYFLYCLVFTPFKMSFKVSMVPLICRALVYDTKFLRYNFSSSSLYRKYLSKGCVWVDANTNTIGFLTSNVEIAIGFLLVLTLFTWLRNVVLTLMYWHLLKLMYHAPPTAMYHQIVWAKISRIVLPYVYRMSGFLDGGGGGHLKRLKKIFGRFDMDSDGSLTHLELAALLRSLGIKPTGDQIHALFCDMDSNENGTVEFEELVSSITPVITQQSLIAQDQLMEVFRSFDRDGNGYITAPELARSMAKIGHPLNFKELIDMMTEADSDGDGRISFDEFATIMGKSAFEFLDL